MFPLLSLLKKPALVDIACVDQSLSDPRLVRFTLAVFFLDREMGQGLLEAEDQGLIYLQASLSNGPCGLKQG